MVSVVPVAVIGVMFAAIVSFANGHGLLHDQHISKDGVVFENAKVAEKHSTILKEEGQCNLTLSNNSVNYWKSMMEKYKPNFIHFVVKIKGANISVHTKVFMPGHWVWTYKSEQGIYPYLHWNPDFNLTSFGLLDTKTLNVPSTPYVQLNAISPCNITLGEQRTTQLIGERLLELTENLTPEYKESYWCFLAEVPGIRHTIQYKFSQYFLYPVSVLNYNCCRTHYSYVHNQYEMNCTEPQKGKWSQCTIVPYILGVIIFLYFPLVILNISGLSCEYIGNDTNTIDRELDYHGGNHEIGDTSTSSDVSLLSSNEPPVDKASEWLFLNGTHPKTVSDVLKAPLWFMAKYPILTSRLKRFMFLLLLPIVVYVKIYVFHKYQLYVTKRLVEYGVPMGMLSILGDEKYYVRVFVPLFKGPVVMLVMYHAFGLLFLVIPNSLQHVVKLGVPSRCIPDNEKSSPLCFTPSEIISVSQMALCNVDGSMSAEEYIRGAIYMLFTNTFWKKAIKIQINRFLRVSFGDGDLQLFCYWCLFFPVYILLCGIELVVCLIHYGIPFAAFMSIMIRGALKVTYLNVSQLRRGSSLDVILSSRLLLVCSTSIIAICFLLFTYSYCLIFIESFTFLSEVFVFCFVAVVVFPSVAFGYLFFFIVLIYYIFRLFYSFGHAYLELLSEAVEVSVNKEGFQNQVTYFNGKLVISNVTHSNIRGLCINDVDITIPAHAFYAVTERMHTGTVQRKVIFRNNTYGIRRDLFDHLVQEFCPVHLQILIIVSQLGLITFLLVFLGSITTTVFTGPSSEISDVMHVIFIVTIGALPRVLEVAMSNSNEHVTRDIRLRRLEQSIYRFWDGSRLIDVST